MEESTHSVCNLARGETGLSTRAGASKRSGSLSAASFPRDAMDGNKEGRLLGRLSLKPNANSPKFGKDAAISRWGSFNLSSTGRSKISSYKRLIGRSGIYETCRRDGSVAAGSCASSDDPLPSTLQDALLNSKGVSHFSQTPPSTSIGDCTLAGPGCDVDGVWRPTSCAAGSCGGWGGTWEVGRS